MPICLGSDFRILVEIDDCDADEAAGEGLARTVVGLLFRCVGIATGSDLVLPDINVFWGDLDLLRDGGEPASKAAACSDSRLLDNMLAFSL